MKQNFLYLMGGMLWAAFQSLSAQPVSWTDDSLQPDTVWFTNNKSEKEYILSRPEELAGLSVLVNSYGYTFQGKTIRLAKDISLKRVIAEEAVCWEPVGDYIRNSKEVYFQGVFDGQGHTIDGMRVIGSHSCSGFFGALKGATVRDVVIGSQSVITTEKTISYIGALAGRVEESRLTGCINKASLSALKEQNIQLGGLVGSLGGESYVENCKNYGNVSAGGYVGGICGVMSTDTIVNCTNLGQLSEAYYDLGGIVGYANGDYRLVNNLNVGLIAGGGGIAGKVYGSYSATAPKGRMANNLNLGEVNPVSNKGHVVVCSSTNTTLIRNYAKQTDLVVGDVSYNALSDEQLKSKNCLLELTANAGYENKLGSSVQALSWQAGENGYPELGSEVAAITYRVEVLPSLLGEPDWNTLASEDVRAAYFEPGTQVILPVRAYKGYTFEGFQVEGVLQAGNTFTMPAKDIQLNLVFHSGNATDWASMAQYAEAGTDYSFEGFTYEVHTPLGLAYIADQVNNQKNQLNGKLVTLTDDINLAKKNADGDDFDWAPIGVMGTPFKGNFDGRGHRVLNMLVRAASGYGGLFGTVSADTLANVTLAGYSAVAGSNYVGALAGYMDSKAMVVNCNNDSCIVKGTNYVGGLIGSAGSGCRILNSSSSGEVCGKDKVGGIVGYLQGEVEACLSSGKVKSEAKGGAILGDGYKPKAMRCYFQEGLVNAGESGETVTGTALSESDIVSENLAKELTAYAGYTNRTVDGCAWGEWRQKADGTVFSSSEKAKDAYAAFVTETAHGAVRLPVVLSRDEEAAFYAIAGQFVPLEINPEEGYKLDCLTLNDEAIELSDGCFVMPDCEAVITATFAEQPTSILSEVQDGIRIWTSGEMLMVVSDTTVPMTVFEMDGRVSVAEKAVSGSVAYRLQPGAYIVQVGTSTYKILINSL